jgi:Flp pilus assembly protein TadG
MQRQKLNKKSERGNSLVEFALGFFLLWGLFSGVYQFGYAFYVYNTLLDAVNDAAQYGARLDYDTGAPAAWANAVKNMVVYGDAATGTKSLVPNFTISNASVSANLDSGGMPTNVTVAVTGYTINALFQSYSLTNKPRITARYYGQVGCASC